MCGKLDGVEWDGGIVENGISDGRGDGGYSRLGCGVGELVFGGCLDIGGEDGGL